MKRLLITLGGVLVLIVFGFYIKQVIQETVEAAKPGQHYVVALGDSVAAGAGLSDVGNRPVGCDLSDAAFPYVLAKQLNLPVKQFACSGATVSTAGGTNSLLGGQYKTALPYLTGNDVVVYAGANDIGWIQTLASCAQTDCATSQTSQVIAPKLKLLQTDLMTLLDQLQQAHPSHLVVNTYYNLLADGDVCFETYGISPDEVSFINDEEAQLNAVITTAATKAKATIVKIDFSGHLLCDATPWIQNISAKAPLHPTAAGQQQIARQDAQALTVTSAR